jgi:hypothetical protein
MKKKETIPEFDSLEEERKYWEERARAPGRWTKNKPQKRSSFLAVRLTGEELTKLRNTAKQQGIGLSSFVRQALIEATEDKEKKAITLTQAIEIMANEITDEDREQLKRIYNNIAIPSLENPMLFYCDKDDMNKVMAILIKAIYAPQGIQIETGSDKSGLEDMNRSNTTGACI